jgi:Rv0078B-related antitoxin
VLSDEQATPEQIEIFRRMTPERRLQLAEQLYWSARHLKSAGLRAQHPDWSDEHIEAEVRSIFTHART